MKQLKKGDKVEWETSQGTTDGVVKQKLTKPRMIKGHKVAASTDDPEYLVETTKTNKIAAHKPGTLKKAGRRK
jgi:Hypervirulence associated proteins TUDOR domain